VIPDPSFTLPTTLANLNKVMLIGNLTRDPELRYTPSGKAVADISLAINRVWNNEQGQKQEDTIFVDVTLWGRQAELAQQYLSKGRCAYIEGRLQMDTWDDKETGKKRSKLKVVGDQLQFMPDGKGGSGGSPPPSQGGPQASQQRSAPPHGATAAPANEFQEEDDIPF
jgi:single-strand DNA-binding protein